MELNEVERRQGMIEAKEVYNCSDTVDHTPNCDRECGKRVLTEMEIKLNREKNRWIELGMVPLGKPPHIPMPGIPVDSFHTDLAVVALIQVLQDKGIVTEDEVNVVFQEKMLERLTEIREHNEDEVRKQQIVGPAPSELIVPDYIKRRKMH